MNPRDSDWKPDPPFPLEALFPGIHAARPDIAAKEAEEYLAFGSDPYGFGLDDTVARRWLTDPAHDFVDFVAHPLPPGWAERIAALPGWEHPDARAVSAALTADLRERVPGLRADLEVRILEYKEAWICRK